ncbi:MAG: hypothetical protein K8W52_18400 [Deltaproteobacteria bacterium]|nr:hypothetical protein [Deltaproteobacteria bacterium]
MRRCFALSLLLVAAFARIGAAGAVAETPAPPAETATAEADEVTPTVQLVQVWPKTKQALMFDPIHGTYVVVSAGQTVDGFRVARVGKRQVTLAEIRTDGPVREFVLLPTPVDPGDPVTGAPGAVTGVTIIGATPTVTPSTVGPTAPTTAVPTAPATPAPAILDPYPSDVLDPYGHDGLRVVQAPADQRAPGSPAAPSAPTPPPTAGTPATPAPIGPAKPATPTVTPAPIPAPKPAIPSTPTAPIVPAVRTTPSTPPIADHVVLSRRELDAALGDFARLTHDSQLALGTGGVSFTRVAAGSLFARVGLRDGDRINAINGVMIRSIDDAAGLYARLGTLDHLSLDVVRGTTKLVLRCDLTK